MNNVKFNELHNFLEQLSPDKEIKLIYDTDEPEALFDGYAGEITESIMFKGWEVTFNCSNNRKPSEMLIWIK